MTIAPTAATPATSLHATTAAAAPKQEMDKEVFLALLVAQLRNQDPTSPMDTSEMMAQTTQLATMEQLTELTDTSRESFALQMRVAASSLVGQQVSFVDADGTTHTGVASSVSFENKVPVVTVGDRTVPLDDVSMIRATTQQDVPASTDTPHDPAGTAGTAA